MGNTTYSRNSQDTRRRGIAAPLLAISMVALITFAALAIDVGYTCVTASELQRTCDASAMAGAKDLPLGETQVVARATEYAGLNAVAMQSVTNALGVTLGHWDGIDREFTPDNGQGFPVNAVHVVGTREDLAMFFGPVVGFDDLDVVREAVAVGGGGICSGIWGVVDVTIGGDLVTDSYLSSDGPYGGNNVRPHGDVCSCQDLRFNGGIEIHGDAMYGSGWTFNPNGNSNEVWGIIDDYECNMPTITTDFVAPATNNDNDLIPLTSNGTSPWNKPGQLQLNSDDVLVLPPGDYYFEQVDVMGQAEIVITGPTNFYLVGDAHFRGQGITNVTQDPHNLTIYSDGHDLIMNGGSGFYGAILAPDSDITLSGDADFYGTILGNGLDLMGSVLIHVDETLVDDLFNLDPVQPVLVK
jgi:hypothetical protein